jgi:hypothetical protein
VREWLTGIPAELVRRPHDCCHLDIAAHARRKLVVRGRARFRVECFPTSPSRTCQAKTYHQPADYGGDGAALIGVLGDKPKTGTEAPLTANTHQRRYNSQL